MDQNSALLTFAILPVSSENHLAATEKKRQTPAMRCARLEALASRFGLSDQEKDEVHRINSDLHKQMILFTS